MRLIFIRHGDPNYEIDSLTDKGWKEAELLAERMVQIEAKEYYCSPLGRAKDTASCTLKRIGREPVIYDWLQEFFVTIIDPNNGKERIPWDFMPSYWTKQSIMYDKDKWMDAPVMQTGNVADSFAKVKNGIDTLLAEYGYHREGNYYSVHKSNEDTIVFFCHLGVQFAILSHLLGIAAPVLWQGFFVAPTSVTVLTTEERVKGEAYFRCKTLGDTSHLYVGDEPPSNSGFFNEIFLG